MGHILSDMGINMRYPLIIKKEAETMKKMIALLLACILTFSLAGCATQSTGNEAPAPGASTDPAGNEPSESSPADDELKVLKYANVYPDMQVLDVMKSTTTDTIQAGSMVCEALLDFEEDFSVTPLLLKEMPTSEDGVTFHCELKEGVLFHDGTELKATDVEFTFKRMFLPETACVNTFLCDMILGAKEMLDGQTTELAGFTVTGDYTFDITLEGPYAPFLSVLACEQLSIYPEKACTEAGDRWGVDVFVGTGPFKLKEFTPKDRLVVERFEDYHGEQPYLDQIEMYNMDANTMLLEYESCNLDIVGVQQDQADAYRNDEAFADQFVINPLIGTISMNLNVEMAPLDNVKVREAIGYAVDRQSMVDNYLKGNAIATSCFIPRGCMAFDEDRPIDKYDPEKAKELLAEAGYPDGIHIVTTISEKSSAVGVATVLQQQMKEAGIEFEIQKVDDAAYIDLRSNGEVQVAFSTWYADIVDPDNFLYTILHSKSSPFFSSNYNNPEFDALLEEARVITDADKREELYLEAEALAVTVDFVNVPLYNPIKFYLVQENVEGAKFLNSMVDLFYVTKS